MYVHTQYVFILDVYIIERNMVIFGMTQLIFKSWYCDFTNDFTSLLHLRVIS
jgi:hypothetical protein